MKQNNKLYFISLAMIAVLALPAANIYAKESNGVSDNNSPDSVNLNDSNSSDNNNPETSTDSNKNDSNTATDNQNRNDRNQTTTERKNGSDGRDNTTTSEQNRNDNNLTSTSERDNNQEDNRGLAEEHRSSVASFVQNLLNLADKTTGGIGDQVREVAKEQNDSKDRVSQAIDAIQNRSKIMTFFLGTDYKNIGQIRSEIVQTNNRIEKLSGLLDTTSAIQPSTSTAAEIANLKLEQEKLNTFVTQNENTFSLFGWLAKMFNR